MIFMSSIPSIYLPKTSQRPSERSFDFIVNLFASPRSLTQWLCIQNKPPKWWGNKNEEDMKEDVQRRKQAQNTDMRFKYVDDSDSELEDSDTEYWVACTQMAEEVIQLQL